MHRTPLDSQLPEGVRCRCDDDHSVSMAHQESPQTRGEKGSSTFMLQPASIYFETIIARPLPHLQLQRVKKACLRSRSASRVPSAGEKLAREC
jgi:hypothetical protein